MFTKAIAIAGGFAALSSAHVLISTPVPFSVPALHNGPLQPDGSDFPCQSTGGTFQAGAANVMELGSTQPLAFVGTAVHGGGSCQISITYDTQPNKNSVWKVIHSIEGGCPARNTPGNLGNDPNFKIPFDYSFPVPTDIPAGNATIAWTWLNKIGNREFYMNCAPVSLTGSGGSKSNWEALPDMLVANIAPNSGCTTQEGKDYKYPNPGKSVQSFASGELAFPQGNCGATSRPPAGGDGGDGGNGGGSPPANPPSNPPSNPPGNPPAPPAPTAAPPSTPTKRPGPPGGGGVFITVTTSDAPAGPTPTAPPVVAPSPPAEEPDVPEIPDTPSAEPPAGGNPPSVGGGAFTPGTACSPEGQWNCIGGTSFQRCASGQWSAIMAVAGGTTCKTGSSSTFEVSKKRRVALRFRG